MVSGFSSHLGDIANNPSYSPNASSSNVSSRLNALSRPFAKQAPMMMLRTFPSFGQQYFELDFLKSSARVILIRFDVQSL